MTVVYKDTTLSKEEQRAYRRELIRFSNAMIPYEKWKTSNDNVQHRENLKQ